MESWVANLGSRSQMSKSKLPEPDTKTALLPSHGYGPGRPVITPHTYTRTRECNLPEDGPALEYLYKCEVTGVERRWGTRFIAEAKSDDAEELS